MTTNHTPTPGPWHVDDKAVAGTDDDGIVIRCADGWRVAETYGTKPNAFADRDAEANARLIAAAPSLLAACKDLVALYASTSGADPNFIVKGRAAITKAEGQP